MNITKTEAKILSHLDNISKSELYGLQMVKADSSLKMGSVYVLLGRLEDKGYVTSRLEEKSEENKNVPRMLYKITEGGSRVFKAYVKANAVYNQEMNIGLIPT